MFLYRAIRTANVTSGNLPRRYTSHLAKNLKLHEIPELPYQEVAKLACQQFTAGRHHVPDPTLSPIVMLHGLFGSKQNFSSVAREITKQTNHQIFGLDLRNHGQSQHVSPYDYTTMARDVIAHFKEKAWDNVILVGHSMGAKVAMLVGLYEPTLVSKLVVIDNSPKSEKLSQNFVNDLVGMCQVEAQADELADKPPAIKSARIETILSSYEPDHRVRFFLLTNIKRPRLERGTVKKNDQGRGSTKHHVRELIFRVPVLNFLKDEVLVEVGNWPAIDTVFDKPVLVMAAKHSEFIQEKDYLLFDRYFPQVEIELFDCGHWIVSDEPEKFIKSTVQFIKRT